MLYYIMLLSTLSYYDKDKYKVIGVESGISTHSVSIFRNFFADIGSIFGGKSKLIGKKYIDIRNEALDDLIKQGVAKDADMIAGIDYEFSEFSKEFLICVATGTLLKKRTAEQRTNKRNKRKAT